MSATSPLRRAALAVPALACGLAVLTACGDQPRDAAAVSTSFSGQVVTGTSTDLGSIVIGWGDAHSDSEITTRSPRLLPRGAPAGVTTWPSRSPLRTAG